MLQTMRKVAHSWVFKGLMSILTLSFVYGVLASDLLKSNPLQAPLAKVGKDSITAQEVNMEFQHLVNYARSVTGQDVSVEQAKKLGLMNTALRDLTERSMINQEAVRLGINVPASVAYAQIAAQPNFRDKDGKFDKESFKRFLQSTQLSEKDFVNQLQRDQVVAVFSAVPAAPEAIATAYTKALTQKRMLNITPLKNGNATVLKALSADEDKNIRTFYDNNSTLFTAPEYRSITVARLSVDDAVKDITISDADLEKEYNEHSDQYSKPERRDLIQVVAQNEEKAKQIAVAAQASGNLTTTAKAMGYDAIPLPNMDAQSLLPELEKPVFALANNSVSDPIKSSLGWHVLQVKKVLPAEKSSFKEVKEQLRKTMSHDQAVESMTNVVNKLDDELGAGHSLDDIASKLNMPLVKITAIDAEGLTADKKTPVDLPKDKESLKVAFSQNSGETSPVMDDRMGNYVVIRTDDVIPAKIRPFDEVKTQAKVLWQEQEQSKLAQAQAQKIAQALNSGKSLSDIAEAKGLTTHAAKPLSMLAAQDAEIPKTAIPQIFKMKKGDAIAVSNGDTQLVLQLIDTQEGDDVDVKASKFKAASSINAHQADELLELYGQYLNGRYPVKIDQEAMDSMTRQGS